MERNKLICRVPIFCVRFFIESIYQKSIFNASATLVIAFYRITILCKYLPSMLVIRLQLKLTHTQHTHTHQLPLAVSQRYFK